MAPPFLFAPLLFAAAARENAAAESPQPRAPNEVRSPASELPSPWDWRAGERRPAR